MIVTLRQCDGKDNVWEVDIRILLPDGRKLRERRQAPVAGKTAALRWAQERERVLLKEGKPKARTSAPREVPTLKEFAPRFLEGYVRATSTNQVDLRPRKRSCASIYCHDSERDTSTKSPPKTYSA